MPETATSPTPAPERQVGPTQLVILQLLCQHRMLSVAQMCYHWPSLRHSMAKRAVDRLGDRNLIDVAGFDDKGRRTFKITDRGRALERSSNPSDDGPGRAEPDQD